MRLRSWVRVRDDANALAVESLYPAARSVRTELAQFRAVLTAAMEVDTAYRRILHGQPRPAEFGERGRVNLKAHARHVAIGRFVAGHDRSGQQIGQASGREREGHEIRNAVV